MPNGHIPQFDPGGNTAYYAAGGGYDPTKSFTTWEPTFPYVETKTPSQVYTGTEPTIYATDTPALIPLTPIPDGQPELPSYDWQVPLDTTGLKFPESTPTTPELPSYDWEAPLDITGLKFPESTPTTPGAVYSQVTSESQGPVEWIVDAAGNVIDFGKSVVEFIGEHMDVGISYRYPGQTRPSQFPSVIVAGKEGSPISPMVFTIPGGIQSKENGGAAPAAPAYVPMSEDERLLYEAQQQSQSDLGRFLIYGGLAFLAYKLLSKK